MNEMFFTGMLFAILIVCIAVTVRSTTTASDRLRGIAISAFFALISGLSIPAVQKMLAAIANIGPHYEGAIVLITSGFIIIVMIMMTVAYSEASSEDEIRALFNKVPNLNRWFLPPPLRDKRTFM